MAVPSNRVLVTRRCVLRYPELSDAASVLEALTDGRFPKQLPIAALSTSDAVMRAIRDRQEAWAAGTALSWYVEAKNGRYLIGMVRIARISATEEGTDAEGEWDLAFWVKPEHWRLGFATEFTREVLRVTFADLCAQLVNADTPTWNSPSRALLQKLGFVLRHSDGAEERADARLSSIAHYELAAARWQKTVY